MSLQQRIELIIKRKRKEQSQSDIIYDTRHQQPIKNCTDKLFRLIVKLEQSKARSKKEYPLQVRQRIFIGNYVFASDEEFLKKNNIGLILSCLSTSPVKSFENVRYQKISIKDQEGEDLLCYSEKVFEMIQKHLQNNPTNIYIHCFHGKSRSPSVLLMYLARKQKRSVNNLFSELKKLYPIAQPNKWFMQQLNQYEKTINNMMNTQSTERTQQDDLLGFDLKLGQTNISNSIFQQKGYIDILENVPVTVPLPDYRQHLLIPEHQKNNSPKKTAQYHLIQIDEDDQNANLI